MAFYVTMSAFIAANLVVIGFELRRTQARAGQAVSLATVRRGTGRP